MTRRAKPERDHDAPPDSAATATTRPAPTIDLLGLQGAAGNQAVQQVVQRYTPSYGYMPGPGASYDIDAEDARDAAASMKRTAESSSAAVEIYGWIGYVGEPPPEMAQMVVTRLAGMNSATLNATKSEFAAADGMSLDDFIVSELLSWDAKAAVAEAGIKSLAILDSGNAHEMHTGIALAVIPKLTRDLELNRIQTTVAGKGKEAILRLTDDYNRVFARAGKGSLEADLRGDLSGTDLQRALALTNHKVTGAEELFLDSVGVTGTEVTKVISRLQAAWDAGPDSFWQLEHDWNMWVTNGNGWTGDTWTNLSMRQAIEGELHDATSSGADWFLARALFDGYERHKAGLPPASSGDYFRESDDPLAPLPPNEEARQAFLTREPALQNELLVHKSVFSVVANSEDAGQIDRAARAVAKLHEERAKLAAATEDQRLIERVKSEWDADRGGFLSALSSEFGPTDRQYLKAQLILHGNLNLADELWLAMDNSDAAKIREQVTSAWAKGKVDELCKQAAEPREIDDPASKDTEKKKKITIRPAFPVYPDATINKGLFSNMVDLSLAGIEGVGPLIKKGATDEDRGVARIKWEVAQEKPDAIYKMLSVDGIVPTLRKDTVAAYVKDALPKDNKLTEALIQAGGFTPEDLFVGAMFSAFPNYKGSYDLQDLLTPAKTLDDLVARASGRYAAEESGAVEWGGWATGEDQGQVARESLERLKFIRDQGTSPGELEALMATLGAKTPFELGGIEYDLLKQRLADMRAMRETMADIVATIAETAALALLTAIAGPAASIWMLAAASAGSTFAGQIARNAILTDEYILFSQDNALDIAKAAVLAAAAKAGKDAVKLREAWLKYKPIIDEVAGTAAQETTGIIGKAAYNQKSPTLGDVAASAAKVGGAGAGAWIKDIPATSTALQKAKVSFIGGTATNVVGDLSDEFNAWSAGAIGDLTPWDMAERVMMKVSVAAGKAGGATIGEVATDPIQRVKSKLSQKLFGGGEAPASTPAGPEPIGPDEQAKLRQEAEAVAEALARLRRVQDERDARRPAEERTESERPRDVEPQPDVERQPDVDRPDVERQPDVEPQPDLEHQRERERQQELQAKYEELMSQIWNLPPGEARAAMSEEPDMMPITSDEQDGVLAVLAILEGLRTASS